MNICNYSGIADYYDKWCTGDKYYYPSMKFYLTYLSRFSGVFAELGVGNGRIAVPLSRCQSTEVYGVDSCDTMLEHCARNISSDTNLHLLKADFMNFLLPVKADIIYMPFRTIGHIMTKSELKDFFCNVRQNLKKGGLFIFDHYMFDYKWAKMHNNVDILMYRDNKIRICDKYEYDFNKNTMCCRIYVNDESVTEFDFRWIDIEEISDVCAQSGFSRVELFGDFDESSWNLQSPNQIWVLKEE